MVTRSNDFAGRFGTTRPGVRLALIAGAVAAVYACDRAASPTGLDEYTLKRLPAVGVTPGVTMLCQVGLGASFRVSIGAVGTTPTAQSMTVADGQCANVANINPAAQDDVIVSIEETPGTFYAVDRIVLQHGEDAPRVIMDKTEVGFEGTHGAVVTFFNNAAVNVCEIGPTATFQYQVGLADGFRALSLVNEQCFRIASIRPASADDVIVTVRQDAAPTRRLDRVSLSLGGQAPEDITGTSSVSFEALHGGTVWFRTVPVP